MIQHYHDRTAELEVQPLNKADVKIKICVRRKGVKSWTPLEHGSGDGSLSIRHERVPQWLPIEKFSAGSPVFAFLRYHFLVIEEPSLHSSDRDLFRKNLSIKAIINTLRSYHDIVCTCPAWSISRRICSLPAAFRSAVEKSRRNIRCSRGFSMRIDNTEASLSLRNWNSSSKDHQMFRLSSSFMMSMVFLRTGFSGVLSLTSGCHESRRLPLRSLALSSSIGE